MRRAQRRQKRAEEEAKRIFAEREAMLEAQAKYNASEEGKQELELVCMYRWLTSGELAETRVCTRDGSLLDTPSTQTPSKAEQARLEDEKDEELNSERARVCWSYLWRQR